jgi:hypothetical protein
MFFPVETKPADWPGWEKGQFGLEVSAPWTDLLLQSKKTSDIRDYRIPPALLHRRIYILESEEKSEEGKSSALGNFIDLTGEDKVRIVGWIMFDSIKEYVAIWDFEADESSHQVKPGSEYGWKEGETTRLFGWVVSRVGTVKKTEYIAASRQMRSLFELYIQHP